MITSNDALVDEKSFREIEYLAEKTSQKSTYDLVPLLGWTV